ncbi:hypothetical protein [Anaerotignum sp.]
MYPYFQKKREQTLETREMISADPLRDFLTQNPNFGTLLFQVTSGQGAFPVAGATVVITKNLTDGHSLSITTTTDESGKTEEFSLPAPSRSLSQTPGGRDVFATYDAVITAPGHVTVIVHDIPIFDGITTIQPVNLAPDLNGNIANETETITDTEPNL